MQLEELYTLPRDDEKVLRAFAADDLTGIFQFEGRATRTIMKRIFAGTDKFPDFMTLADINALSRPGSLISGMTDTYIAVERGAEPKLIHPVVDEILAETNYCLVYQEQVMQIGSQFGGLKDDEIGLLRKIIGSKQAGGAFDEFWVKFRDGARELHGVSEVLAREVWDYMAASASYLFNVAHAISYALVGYWCMYLKVYHPVEFFASALASAAGKSKVKGKDPQLPLLQDAISHGLSVSPPHPAESGYTWKPNREGTGLLAGFTQLPGVGDKTAENMLKYQSEVSQSAFESFGEDSCAEWDDFVKKASGFGPTSARKAREFCAKKDPFNIRLTNTATHSVRQAINSGQVQLLVPDATSASIPSQVGQKVTYIGHVISVKEIDVIMEMRTRKNMTTQEVKAKLKQPDLSTKAKVVCVDEGGGEVHININRFLYPDVKEHLKGMEKGIFVAHSYGEATNAFGPAIQAETFITIELTED